MIGIVRALPIVLIAATVGCASPSSPRPLELPREPALPPAIDVVEPDVDADGIRGADDHCPSAPETYNDVLDRDGCPDDRLFIVPPDHIAIVAGVAKWDYASAKINSGYVADLDAIARTLRDNAQIGLVQVEVHTDERGPASDNLALSDARAQAVVDRLVANGVSKARVRAKGFGEYCPLDPAHNETAWEKNRRTLFRIAKYEGIRGYDELGCAAATALGVQSLPIP